MLQDGRISRDYYISPESTENWIPIFQMPELQMSGQGLIHIQKKLRNGFTSFWLWLCIIINMLGGIFLLWPLLERRTFSDDYALLFFMCIFTIFSLFGILNWKRKAFWVFLVIQIIGIVWNFIGKTDYGNQQVIGMVISTIVLYGVLHLKSVNGITTWEQME
jgi:hypothetical protein